MPYIEPSMPNEPEKVESNLPLWLLSSTGTGLSLRVKSFLIGILPTALVVSKLIGYPILETDATAFVDIAVTVIESVVAIIAGFYQFAGWKRATFYKKNLLGKFKV